MVGGDRLLSPGPTGIVGFATTTGRPFASQRQAYFSASSFDRQYGPTASLNSNLNIFINRSRQPLALVRMLSVLVWSTRLAPAASAASSTLTVPR